MVDFERLVDRVACWAVGSRGQQRNRKDKDLMSDTGGTSKGRGREPRDNPPRYDRRERYRTKDKRPSERDPDTDLDPDTKKDPDKRPD